MKKIFSFIFLLCLVVSLKAQPPVTVRGQVTVTAADYNLFTLRSFRVPVFPDTLSASNLIAIDLTQDSCGMLIYTYDSNFVWFRSCEGGHHWEPFGSGGGGGDQSWQQTMVIGNTSNIDAVLTDGAKLSFDKGSHVTSLRSYNFGTTGSLFLPDTEDSSTLATSIVVNGSDPIFANENGVIDIGALPLDLYHTTHLGDSTDTDIDIFTAGCLGPGSEHLLIHLTQDGECGGDSENGEINIYGYGEDENGYMRMRYTPGSIDIRNVDGDRYELNWPPIEALVEGVKAATLPYPLGSPDNFTLATSANINGGAYSFADTEGNIPLTLTFQELMNSSTTALGAEGTFAYSVGDGTITWEYASRTGDSLAMEAFTPTGPTTWFNTTTNTLWYYSTIDNSWHQLQNGGGACTPTWQQTLLGAGATLTQSNLIDAAQNSLQFTNNSYFYTDAISVTGDTTVRIELNPTAGQVNLTSTDLSTSTQIRLTPGQLLLTGAQGDVLVNNLAGKTSLLSNNSEDIELSSGKDVLIGTINVDWTIGGSFMFNGAPGTDGQVLTSHAASPPTWEDAGGSTPGIDAVIAANNATTTNRSIQAGTNDFYIQSRGLTALGDWEGLGNGNFIAINDNNDIESLTATSNNLRIITNNNHNTQLYTYMPYNANPTFQVWADSTDNISELFLWRQDDADNPFYEVRSDRTNDTRWIFKNNANQEVAEFYGVDKRAEFHGRVEADSLVTMENYYTTSATPGIAAGAGAGTSPTVSITGTNAGGVIEVVAGTLPTALATIATITFSNAFAFPNGCSVTITPQESSLSLTGVLAVGATGVTTGFTFSSVGLGAGTYRWNYKVEGY